jgi:ankyrin repeat protein
LPSLTEEEDQIVEFGETKFHGLAATQGANLTIELKTNHQILAARNKDNRTPRDVAKELKLDDNVKQIDEFVLELVAQENYKPLFDLVTLGFEDLVSIVEAKYGNADKMRENGLDKQAEQIYTVIPAFNNTLKEIKDHVEKNELDELKAKLDKKSLAHYRDLRGRSPLHTAIEKKFFEMAVFLINKFPLLAKLNDNVSALLFKIKTPITKI